MREAVMTADELQARLAQAFPETFNPDTGLSIQQVWFGGCRMCLGYAPSTLRPGGTISGPTIMMLADVAMYVAVLAAIGWEPLAVTTNLNINFLKKPEPGGLLAEARLMKLGRRLAVGEVGIRSDGVQDLVAHATLTYSMPQQNK